MSPARREDAHWLTSTTKMRPSSGPSIDLSSGRRSWSFATRQRAEDITQDAFVQLYRHWKKVSLYEWPEAWVRRVAIRLAVRDVKRTRVRAVLEPKASPRSLRFAGPGRHRCRETAASDATSRDRALLPRGSARR